MASNTLLDFINSMQNDAQTKEEEEMKLLFQQLQGLVPMGPNRKEGFNDPYRAEQDVVQETPEASLSDILSGIGFEAQQHFPGATDWLKRTGRVMGAGLKHIPEEVPAQLFALGQGAKKVGGDLFSQLNESIAASIASQGKAKIAPEVPPGEDLTGLNIPDITKSEQAVYDLLGISKSPAYAAIGDDEIARSVGGLEKGGYSKSSAGTSARATRNYGMGEDQKLERELEKLRKEDPAKYISALLSIQDSSSQEKARDDRSKIDRVELLSKLAEGGSLREVVDALNAQRSLTGKQSLSIPTAKVGQKPGWLWGSNSTLANAPDFAKLSLEGGDIKLPHLVGEIYRQLVESGQGKDLSPDEILAELTRALSGS